MMAFRSLVLLVLLCIVSSAYAAPATGPEQQQVKTQVEALQQTLLADRDILVLLQVLQDNPEIQALLQDPEIVNAVNSGDVSALTGNPKFLELFNNPQIQEIQRKLKQ